MDLFDNLKERDFPLAWRLKPSDLSDMIGQDHILSKGRALRSIIENDRIISVIFYGPPGTGKTALAHIIAKKTKAEFIEINAVTSGVKEIREAVKKARSVKTLVFIDEIHRFNKVQQDALLPHIERGEITLVGATTENPFFALIPALSSRTLIFKFTPLTNENVRSILSKALSDKRALGEKGIILEDDAADYIINKADGDARKALNILELAYLSSGKETSPVIDIEHLKKIVHDKTIYYDVNEHYDIISAFIKSMRGSDPDATAYWLAKMLEAGEDPLFIGRRIVICASEDVGNADPAALGLAVSALLSVERIGMPEGRIPLSQAAIYIASAPKSNACYMALESATEAVRKEPARPVPDHLKGSGYAGALRLGVQGYKYPHDYNGHYVEQDYMTNKKIFYEPSEEGFEFEIKKRLATRRQRENG